MLYSLQANRLVDAEIFERLTKEETREMFDAEDGYAKNQIMDQRRVSASRSQTLEIRD